jgi:hypothetical protein
MLFPVSRLGMAAAVWAEADWSIEYQPQDGWERKAELPLWIQVGDCTVVGALGAGAVTGIVSVGPAQSRGARPLPCKAAAE